MTRYILRRVLMIAISMVVVSELTFYLLHAAPGNFYDIQQIQFQQQEVGTTQRAQNFDVTRAVFDSRYGTNTPTWLQALIFLRYAVVFDLGPSFRYPDQPIQSMIARTFPVTFAVVFLAMALALAVGIPLGIAAALNQGGPIDRAAMFFSMIGLTIPSYVLAVLFILLFAVHWRILPTQGWGKPDELVMPVVALALAPIAGFARYMRSSLVDAMKEDYVRTAFAKGGTLRRVVLGHALRNSLIPLITVAGPQFAFLMVGAVWVETIFNLPGMGKLFATAAPTRDYPLIIASSFFFAVLIMVMNLLVDIAYGFLDPRIRQGYAAGR